MSDSISTLLTRNLDVRVTPRLDGVGRLSRKGAIRVSRAASDGGG